MCLICEEYKKGKLKAHEALRNLEEMKSTMDRNHYNEIHKKIYLDYIDEELDEYWYSIHPIGFGD